MDTEFDGTQATKRPGGAQARSGRPGQSGEGSRSVMEQLIQQEQNRVAQLPRDAGPGGKPEP